MLGKANAVIDEQMMKEIDIVSGPQERKEIRREHWSLEADRDIRIVEL